MHGRKRTFSIVFDSFHINCTTAVFCRIVSVCKRLDTAFSRRIRSFSTVYDTVKYGRNTVHMKRVKYGRFTVINDSIRDGFQRIRSPYLSTWVPENVFGVVTLLSKRTPICECINFCFDLLRSFSSKWKDHQFIFVDHEMNFRMVKKFSLITFCRLKKPKNQRNIYIFRNAATQVFVDRF